MTVELSPVTLYDRVADDLRVEDTVLLPAGRAVVTEITAYGYNIRVTFLLNGVERTECLPRWARTGPIERSM